MSFEATSQSDIKCFSATAQSVQTMIIGRLLTGLGIGISSAIVPLYISEVPLIKSFQHVNVDIMIKSSFVEFVLQTFYIEKTLQISPTEIRGTLGSVNQLFICVGILAALVAGLPLVGNPAWYVWLISTIFPFHLFNDFFFSFLNVLIL